MPTAGERLSVIETMLAEVHLAVVGNGAAGSSLRERTAALEEWRRAEGGLRHKGVRAGGQAILAAAVAIVIQALHVSLGTTN